MSRQLERLEDEYQQEVAELQVCLIWYLSRLLIFQSPDWDWKAAKKRWEAATEAGSLGEGGGGPGGHPDPGEHEAGGGGAEEDRAGEEDAGKDKRF